ncbi:MAG: hypothetical protein ACI4W0_03385, partial [Bacilli bacterium]
QNQKNGTKQPNGYILSAYHLWGKGTSVKSDERMYPGGSPWIFQVTNFIFVVRCDEPHGVGSLSKLFVMVLD